MSRIAIIPARGGSKRIPRKNIKEFFGKPMITWVIENAIKSGLFDRVIVSTDDEEIASIATQYGAEVPFFRPDELADDYAGTTEVVAHSINKLISDGYTIDSVCCIYATAVFTRQDDLIESYKLYKTGRWSYVFSAINLSSSIYRSFVKGDDSGVHMFFPDLFRTRSQDLKDVYIDAGQFYWGKPEAWIKNEIIFSSNSTIYSIPKWRVQDIDSIDDWKRAEILFKAVNG